MKNIKDKLKKAGKKVVSLLGKVQWPAVITGAIIGVNIGNFNHTKKEINSYDNPALKVYVAKEISERYMNKGILYKTFNLASYFNASKTYIESSEKLKR